MKVLAIVLLLAVGTFAMQETVQKQLLSLKNKMDVDGEMPEMNGEMGDKRPEMDGEMGDKKREMDGCS